MKKSRFILAIAALGLLLTSCVEKNQPQTKVSLDDFESVNLPANNASADSANAKFVNGNGIFTVNAGGFWNGGIICSAQTDTITPTYTNYSSITGTGAPESNYISAKYGFVYGPGSFTCSNDPFGYFSIQSIMLTNSTYAYRVMQTGNAFSHKFASGDWFKVIITGFKATVKTGSVEYYLADFTNGKSFILKTWTKVDLTSLGEVDKVTFTFDSSDKSNGYLNTPAYVCIDNIYFNQTYSTPL